MSLLEQIANQLAEQRNQSLNALAEAQARVVILTGQLQAVQAELAQLKEAPHPSDTGAVRGE